MTRVLCCRKGRMWLPDQFLTAIFDDCSRGKFTITRPFTFPCSLLPNGNLYIDEREGVELPFAGAGLPGDDNGARLDEVRCATCGGEVEIREADVKAILDGLRNREITMKVRSRESAKLDKDEGRT